MSNQENKSNDPLSQYMPMIANGVNMTVKGSKEMRTGSAIATTGILQTLKTLAVAGNVEDYNRMIERCYWTNANGKKQPETFEAAKDFWNQSFQNAVKKAPDLELKTSETVEDVEDRRESNKDVSNGMATLKFATAIAVAFDECKLNWNHVGFHKVEGKPVVSISMEDAILLFGTGKEKAIRKNVTGATISNLGVFNYAMVRDIGNEILVKAGVREKAKGKAAVITPLRDDFKALTKRVEDADVKAFDNETSLQAWSAMVALIDAFNQPHIVKRVPSSIVKPFRDWLEKEITDAAAAKDAKVAELSAAIAKNVETGETTQAA